MRARGVLEHGAVGRLGRAEASAARGVELDRQQGLERGARVGARVVQLAGLHAEPAAGLDEGEQRIDEGLALRFGAADAPRVHVAEQHHVVVVEQLLARRRQRGQGRQVLAGFLGEVRRGRAQVAAHADVGITALEELLEEAVLPARVAVHVQDADRLGRDAHAEAQLVVVEPDLARERGHAHQEVAAGFARGAALAARGDQGQARAAGLGALLALVDDAARGVVGCGQLLEAHIGARLLVELAEALDGDPQAHRQLVVLHDRLGNVDQLERQADLVA